MGTDHRIQPLHYEEADNYNTVLYMFLPLQMEELVDSWDFNFSYDFIFFPGHIHGIVHADAAGKLAMPSGALLSQPALTQCIFVQTDPPSLLCFYNGQLIMVPGGSLKSTCRETGKH